MTLELFIEKYKIKDNYDQIKESQIPQAKTINKIINRYKYIEVDVYWFNDSDEPDALIWVDVEGIEYGWLWVGLKSKKKQRRKVAQFAKEQIRNRCDNKCYYTYEKDVMTIFVASKDAVCKIILSDKEL